LSFNGYSTINQADEEQYLWLCTPDELLRASPRTKPILMYLPTAQRTERRRHRELSWSGRSIGTRRRKVVRGRLDVRKETRSYGGATHTATCLQMWLEHRKKLACVLGEKSGCASGTNMRSSRSFDTTILTADLGKLKGSEDVSIQQILY
jgi:hypothetical protein